MKEKQDRYFDCMDVCNEHEQEESCTEVCIPALEDDDHHPQVKLPDVDKEGKEVYPPELSQEEKHVRDIWLGTQWD